ncbi:MAG: DNA polymerase I [Bradymonadales bacterium]|nr:MAG: DNA polymerase I [Bradymonadales bacterium]
MSKSGSIFVIDASAFVFRAYYALAPLSSKGRPSHAVSGFASMLLKVLTEKRPKACVVVFDSKKPSFRKDIFPEYKANREIPPPDISDQIVAVMDLVKAAGLPVLQEEGFEADDWIASFTKNYKSKDEIIIVSSDKDLAQLVNSKVKLWDSFRDRLMGPKEVREKWGVDPEQMRDYQALVGDSSDNIPGLPGVGPKTASQLLAEHQSLSGILKKREKLKPKLKEKIDQHEETLKLSYELVGLKEDLKLPFSKMPELNWPLPQGFHDFLVDWDLNRIIQQFSGDLEPENQAEAGAGSFEAKLIQTEKEWKSFLQAVQAAGHCVFDVETSSFNKDEARLVGVAFCSDSKSSYYLPYRHGESAVPLREKKKWLQDLFDSQVRLVAHHAKYDWQMLTREGIRLPRIQDDTMVIAHLLHADRRSFSLDNLAQDFLGEKKGDLKKLLGKDSEDFSKLSLDEALGYAARDAWLTLLLYERLKPELEKNSELLWIYDHIEMPLVIVLAEMEERGVLMDQKKLKSLSKAFHQRIEKSLELIYEAAGGEFNVASPKQLQEVLFEKIGLTPTKKTKTGFSTDESVLQELSSEHDLPRLILEHRKISKLCSTYVDKFPELISKEDDRLHTQYHQTGTATGRLSSSDPNLQNIPVRSEEGLMIREAFVPAEGFIFVSADYSQVELRLMAHFSEDKKMIEAFQAGRDIHAETAKLIFGSSEKEFRSRAKAINFGIIYGISAYGLSKQLGLEMSEAKAFIEAYFEQFPKVRDYMDRMIELGRKKRYSETAFGRRRPLPDIHSKNQSLRQMAERIAINAPLQGTAADIMKWAMVQVARGLQEGGLKARLLLQVHDELILEVPEAEREAVEGLLPRAMSDLSETPMKALRVPLEVDLSAGKNWASL